jgi:tRNA(Arg) A34 adenosine deaminase TadA
MKLAIKQALESSKADDFPVGAVLVINNKLVGQANNIIKSKKDWHSHAEVMLIQKYSSTIRKLKAKDKVTHVTLYTTLEPCLMCLGSCILTRVDEIIFGCIDPRGGAANTKQPKGKSFYKDFWPKISGGLFQNQIFKIMRPWMEEQNTEQWNRNIALFDKAMQI